MFKSIRWKFIMVYFLLVFIAMVIVGVFIVGKLEEEQLQYRDDFMTRQIESIISTSSYLSEDNWELHRKAIEETISDWSLDSRDTVYIIYGQDPARILASSSKNYEAILGQNAYSHRDLNPSLIFEGFNGKKATIDMEDSRQGLMARHIAYPVINEKGRVKGLVYMTSDLTDIYGTLESSRNILRNAIFLALSITIVLGFLIAKSITEPIADVTEKAEKMAGGDFNQYVEVKSDDEIGQLAHMFNYLTLQLKSSIEEIDLERSKLDTVFRYMAEGVLAIDKNRRIILINPVAEEILRSELGSLDLKDGEKIYKKLLKLEDLDYGQPESLEGDKTIKIGAKTYRLRYAPFKNEGQAIAGIIVVFQDITEEFKLDSMRREFVANVSHELKTPITTIKSYTETLMDHGDIDRETSRFFLAVINKESDRMNRIVKDLLDLSNLDYNKGSFKKEEIELLSMIDDIILKLRPSLEEKGHKFSLELEPDLSLAYADPDGLEQVLINILSNAIKYTDFGGSIDLSLEEGQDQIVIRLRDNGLGIPREDLDRIFERFYRVDKARSRESGGSGLGLSIAKELMEKQGGDLKINSEYGRGTEVLVYLNKAEKI